MKKYRILLTISLLCVWLQGAFAQEGTSDETQAVYFTANTTEGVAMTFLVTSEDDKTCEVSPDADFNPTVDASTTGVITIPSEANGYTVTSISEFAFLNCSSLTGVTIPEGVTSIEGSAFAECRGLTSLSIPASATSIDDQSFTFCEGLESITVAEGNTKYDSRDGCNAIIDTNNNYLKLGCKNTVIPTGIARISSYAFYGCTGLTEITIPEGVQRINEGAFSHCTHLASITLPEGLNSIGTGAFTCCEALTGITIPSTVKTISSYAFEGCTSLTSFTIPEKVTSINGGTFNNCTSLASVTIPEKVTSIGDVAFWNCTSLASVTIPEKVTEIDTQAFRDCTALTEITIPSGVTSIGNFAFNGCTALTKVTSLIQEPFEINDNVFSVYDTATLYVPDGTKETYAATSGWKNFGTITENTTGIITMSDERSLKSDGWYTLDGRKLAKKPTTKGVNIYNGKKRVVK